MPRKFIYHGMELVDPDPQMSVEQVRDLHSVTHPELANASVTGPRKSGEDQIWTFARAVGAKG
ncbi:MAG: PRTRC system protein C [Longimicrobiales bacterium]